MKYLHLTEDEDLGYSLQEEILEYNGRQLFYLISELSDESYNLGCGPDVLEISRQETKTAFVKGYVVRWKYAKDETGADVSEIEAISEKDQEIIKQLIESESNARSVYFG